jgi:hypothetical protein
MLKRVPPPRFRVDCGVPRTAWVKEIVLCEDVLFGSEDEDQMENVCADLRRRAATAGITSGELWTRLVNRPGDGFGRASHWEIIIAPPGYDRPPGEWLRDTYQMVRFGLP